MGLSDYTNSNDDDQGGGSGPGGPGGPGIPAFPGMAGVTGSLDDITEMLIDYNERFKNATPALFREGHVAQTISVLIGKSKPNPLLVGPAGVGKTRIVEELARAIAVKSPIIPAQLSGSTVYELPLSNLVAGAGVVGQLEERLAQLVDFASDKKNDVILFIDEIHLLQDSRDPVYKKVSQILKPALARGDMRLIGATTMNEAKSFDDDPAFQRRFSRLVVDELTREQTIVVLEAALPSFIAHYKNKISVAPDLLTKLAVIADENSRASSHRPDNALTLLDRAMADTVVAHSTAIASANAAGNYNAAQALQSIAMIPLKESKLRAVAVRLMTGLATKEAFDEARVLTELSRIKGQDEITADLIDALRRDDLGTFPRTRPMAWMFAGPSGVGKTEVAKIVAQELTNQPPIMLNMGEYAHEHDVSRLIGAGPGYVGSTSDKELPFDTLESNPYRVILLDEIEKAHRVIHRLFLTALDEGWMRLASGKVVDFSKTIIIATTNGARDINKPTVGFAAQAGPRKVTRQELTKALQEHFDAEFLGRFTKLIAFASLTRETYEEILVDSYARERARIAESDPLTAQLIPEPIDPIVLANTVHETYLPDQGARPAMQAARVLIEDAVIAARFPAAVATFTTDAVCRECGEPAYVYPNGVSDHLALEDDEDGRDRFDHVAIVDA